MALFAGLAGLISVIVLFASIHGIQEGHRGVYWRGGALLKSVTSPGFHVKLPVITAMAQVQVTVQTDSVMNIPCGTSGGVVIHFAKVEVVNRLREDFVYETIKNYTVNYDKTWIFDKIHHEINQFCSGQTLQEVYITLFDTLDERLALALQRDCNHWAPGIEIIAVRVTKPKIPEQIRRNFEAMEAEKTKLLIATETQRVAEVEAQTEKLRATIEARMKRDVSEINMKKKILEKEAEKNISALDNEISTAHSRAATDAEHYRAMKEAEANREKLTPEYIQYMQILAMSNNTKVYFGEKIPNMMISRRNGDGRSSAAAATAASDRRKRL